MFFCSGICNNDIRICAINGVHRRRRLSQGYVFAFIYAQSIRVFFPLKTCYKLVEYAFLFVEKLRKKKKNARFHTLAIVT